MYIAHDPRRDAVRDRVARLRRLLDAIDAQLPAALSERTGAALARSLDAAAACIADATREGL